MSDENALLLGEFRRTLDDRYRLTLPNELASQLSPAEDPVIVTKERPGCLSLWNARQWQSHLSSGMSLVQQKIASGRLMGRLDDVQRLGRLLSTRHTEVALAGRSRLVVPEGFREFLGVEPGQETFVVGAALCVEIWKPTAWFQYIEQEMPEFRKLFDSLST